MRKRLVMGRVLSAWLCGCARLGVAICGWLRQMRGQVGGIRDRRWHARFPDPAGLIARPCSSWRISLVWALWLTSMLEVARSADSSTSLARRTALGRAYGMRFSAARAIRAGQLTLEVADALTGAPQFALEAPDRCRSRASSARRLADRPLLDRSGVSAGHLPSLAGGTRCRAARIRGWARGPVLMSSRRPPATQVAGGPWSA
jgi:hypothetical protein